MNIDNKSALQELKEFYISQIEENFYPYWSKYIDIDDGGIFTCINNYGDMLISSDKYVWSQGRFLWLLAYLYEMSVNGILKLDAEKLKLHADKLQQFIISNCVLENNSVTFLTDSKGNIKKDPESNKIDSSIFADCFAVIGLAAFANHFKDKEVLIKSVEIYKTILNRVKTYKFNSEPYPVPEGLKTHSIPMILINVETELILAAESLQGKNNTEELKKSLKLHIDEIMNEFYRNSLINEFIPASGDKLNDKYEMLLEHKNPGHAIESMWFIVEAEKLLGKSVYIKNNESVILNSLKIGWDSKYGGLLRFVDTAGKKPEGKSNNERYEQLIKDTWDMKLWWPHSEALYALLLCGINNNNSEFSHWFEKVFKYTFSVFPNKDIGEWIQIRKRDGVPENKIVALPVKDPFHILRYLLKSVILIDEKNR